MGVSDLEKVLEKHREWILGDPAGEQADLQKADLRGRDLSCVDLRWALLQDAILEGVNLQGTALVGANLERVNAIGADLRYTNLYGASLASADLSEAFFDGAYLGRTCLYMAALMNSSFKSAVFREADLRGASLRGANLQNAYFVGADLTGANLEKCNLQQADLSRAKGLPDPIKFVVKNFERTDEGVIVYKVFGYGHEPNPTWNIKPGGIIEEVVNFDRTLDCACGVNVATLDWIKGAIGCPITVWRCLIKWEWLPGVCVPYNSYGKIRASKVQLLEQIDVLE